MENMEEQEQDMDKQPDAEHAENAVGDMHQKPEEHTEGRVSPVPSPPPPPPPPLEEIEEKSDHETGESEAMDDPPPGHDTPPPPPVAVYDEGHESPPPPKDVHDSPPPPQEDVQESPPASPQPEEDHREPSPEPFVPPPPVPLASEEQSSPEPEIDEGRVSPGLSDEGPPSDHEEHVAPVAAAAVLPRDSISSDERASLPPHANDESPIPSSPEADESTLEREHDADHEESPEPEVNAFVAPHSSDAIEVENDERSSKKTEVKENGKVKKVPVVVSAGYKDVESGGCCPEAENIHRGNWDCWWEFPLVALGFVMNLDSMMRFPAMFQKHGGAAFLIPYTAFLLLMGLPIVCIQFFLGQYNSSSVIGCFLYAPFYQGIGLAMLISAAYYAIYNTIVMSWAAYYLYDSVIAALRGDTLPWSSCSNPYNTPKCYELAENYTKDARLAEEEYFFNLRLDRSAGIESWSELNIPLLICSAAFTGVVILCVSCGVKSIGKAAYVTTLIPLFLLAAFLIRAAMARSSSSALSTVDLMALVDGPPWKDAAMLVFYTLLPGFGGLITLASFNRFHTDIVCHTMVVVFGGFAFSFISAVIMFLLWDSSLSTYERIDSLDNYTFDDFRVFFAGMARLLSSLPAASPIWSALYFLWLILIGLGTHMVMVFAITTAIVDAWKVRWFLRPLVAFFVCAAIYALHLTLPTDAGYYVLTIMFKYIECWSVMLIILVEIISLIYVYGFKKVWNDIELMMRRSCMCLPWVCCSYYFLVTWIILAPLCVAFGMVYWWVDFKRTELEGQLFPVWADVLGWLMAFTLVVAVLIVAIASIAFTSGTVFERLSNAHSPFKFWGPALLKHRQRVDHIPGFVRDPWEEGEDIELTKTTKTNVNY